VRGGRVAIAAVAVVLAGLVFAGSALACSCAPAAPAESLAESDAAIVGRLLAVESHGPARAKYRYEVLRVYRGRDAIEPGSTLKVLSPRSSAACGLPDRVGHRFGLFLLRSGGRWASGLCGVISPRRLWAAAQKHAGAAGRSAASAASVHCAT
jgi:Tissue inhibitor of metalloproteinase